MRSQYNYAKEFKGFVRWFDKTGNDGILTCLETGHEYYFNSYSDETTVYVVTGICKETGKQKTIETRSFPGLFLDYKLKAGSQIDQWTYDTPVRFNQAKGIEQRWAVQVEIDLELTSEVQEYKLINLLDCLLAVDMNEGQKFLFSRDYYEKQINRLFDKAV